VLIDSRERKPFSFPGCKTRVTLLRAGDYSIAGRVEGVAIERKGSAEEFARNCGSDWGRQRRALDRLAMIPYRAIVAQFTMNALMKGSMYGRVPVETILARLSEITLDMGIPVLFAGEAAEEVTRAMLYRFAREHT
jgi:ERCC4-type nuclease